MVPWWLRLQISCISADTKSIGYAIIQSSFWLIYTVKGRVCVQLCFLPVYIYAYVLVLRTVRLRDLLRLCAKSYLRLRNYNVIYIYTRRRCCSRLLTYQAEQGHTVWIADLQLFVGTFLRMYGIMKISSTSRAVEWTLGMRVARSGLKP